jgi:predicted  nucleic acid-binding Zn-ribbon protein
MAASTVKRYERALKARRGIAVAEVVEGRCNQCHMALRLQYFQDLKKDTEILSCESCQRLLYYNPPVAVEDLAGEPAPAVQQ